MTHPGSIRAQSRIRRTARHAAALAAVAALALLLLAGAEAGLRAAGYGRDTQPFYSVSIEAGSFRFVDEAFFRRFLRDTKPSGFLVPLNTAIPVPKPAGAYRVFVFGESAAYGWVSPDHAFSTLLEAMLRKAYPERRFEVFNVAFQAMSSHVMREMAEACAELEPDLFVLYTGNNEFVGPLGLQSELGSHYYPAPLMRLMIRLQSAAAESRLYQALGDLARRAGRDPVERQRWGIDAPVTSMADPRVARTYRLFEDNLRAIRAAGRRGGADTILCTMAYNLRDWLPSVSIHASGLDAAARTAWQAAFDAGAALEAAGDRRGALEAFARAAALDAGHADLAYRMGACAYALGDFDAARAHFLDAVDHNFSMASANRAINASIRRVAAESPDPAAALADAEAAVAATGAHGIAGREAFFDHVHLTFEGNCAIARAVFERIAAALPPGPAGPPQALSLDECRAAAAWSPEAELRQAVQVAAAMRDFDGHPAAEYFRARQADLERSVDTASREAEYAFAERAIAAGYDHWMLRWSCADAAMSTGRAPRAVDLLRALHAEYPGSYRFWSDLSNALSLSGQYDASEAERRRIEAAYPAFAR